MVVKFVDFCKELDKKKVVGFVFFMFDEIVWFFNFCGSDIVYNLVFFLYVIVM